MNKVNKKVPSPFSTGGGGTRFEWLVATSYLVALLRGETSRGLSGQGVVTEVRFQQRAKGYHVDDIVIVAALGTRRAKLALQVKHNVRFTTNDLFCDILAVCWQHFTSRIFDEKRDFIGIAISEICNIRKVRIHVQELLEWARTSARPQSFFKKLQHFREKQKCLDVFEQSLSKGIGYSISKEQLWRFLRHFIVVPFDFDHPGSRDATDCWNRLQGIIRRRRVEQATELFNALYQLASRYSKAGGEIDFDLLRTELAGILPINCVPDVCTVKAALVQQVGRQLEREKRSKKYIPDVFTEIHTVKESARFFSHSSLFLHKTIDSVQKVDTSFLNRILSKLGLQPVHISFPKGFRFLNDVSRISSQCAMLISHFENIAQTCEDYHREAWDKFVNKVPTERQYIFKEAKYLLSSAGYAVSRSVRGITDDLCEGKSRVLLLTSRAGQGKTCFVCDFTENFMLARDLPCLLITGREFRNVPAGNLGKYIAGLVMGADFDGSLRDLLQLVGDLCNEMNAYFTIIFDGINEHSQITTFAIELERLIERLVEFPFVKIILTCRSEYFSERFSNLLNASFADELYPIYEIQRDMSPQHRKQMESAYFKFFKIRPTYMSGKVSQALQADPLLLRFFCEAYGDPEAKKFVRLPSMPDIYREVVFRRYLDKKLKEVAERKEAGPGVGIPLYRAYKELLKELVSTMIDKKTFSDIPISDIDGRHYGALSELIAEDVFLRKDIMQGKSALDTRAEVINFTFDEFRDYLLADHLLHTVWEDASSIDVFANLVRELTERTSPISEGVSGYLFYAEKRLKDEELSEVLKTMPWYNEVFMDCIFSVEDEYITEDDTEKIRDAFIRDEGVTQQIVFALMVRWDTEATPQLNIDLLFNMLDSLSNEQYDRLIRPIFEDKHHRYALRQKPPYEIGRLASDIERFVSGERGRWDLKYKKVLEFLIYLFSIMDEEYTCPAFDVFRRFAEKQPEQGVSLLIAHVDTKLSVVRSQVWEMLAELASKSIVMPESLIKGAENRLVAGTELIPREKAEIIHFLKSCRDKLGAELSEEVLKLIPTEVYISEFWRSQ